MELRCWSSAPKCIPNPTPQTDHRPLLCIGTLRQRKPPKCCPLNCLLKFGGVEDIAAIAHNKVLIAAGVSAAIGQLSKPFTSQLLYGKNFDLMTAFQAGGFPSTHSSAVIATATSLALERGFSDSIFGLTAVYAVLIMYDAQGVRREVGIHAKTLNKVLNGRQINSVASKDRDDLMNTSVQGTSSTLIEPNVPPLLSKEGRAFVPNSTKAPVLLNSDSKRTSQTNQVQIFSSLEAAAAEGGRSEGMQNGSSVLKESIGHSEVEVIAGALLGFFVGLTVYVM